MKLLALVSYKVFPPHMGGQKGVVHFYEALHRHHPVLMAVSTDNWETIEAPFPVVKLLFPNKQMGRNLFLLHQLVALIKQHNIEAIVAEHSYTGWIGWLLHLRTGLPFVIHNHNIETDRFRHIGRTGWQLYGWYESWIHRRAHQAFFISDEDRQKAMRLFHLPAAKCTTVTYGTERPVRIQNASAQLRQTYAITTPYVLYFNGTLDYEPNVEAVAAFVQHIHPHLERMGFDYTLLLTGKRLSTEWQRAVAQTGRILYLDFVPDANLLYQGSHVFINPVVHDSGIKTKVVEALANHCNVVSTVSGANGIAPKTHGGKLVTVPDGDWPAFARAICQCVHQGGETPAAFFDFFSWTNIAALAAARIQQLSPHAPH